MISGEEVVGELRYDSTSADLLALDAYWRPYARLALPEFDMREASDESVPDYIVWSWAGKMAAAGTFRRFFSLEYRNFVQGAIAVSTQPQPCSADEHAGKLSLEVEYLATAPWNIGRFMRAIDREPFCDLIGPTLMRVAIALSQSTGGCEGRLCLYAVPNAERFYRVNCGMIDLGVETHNEEELRRFEMTSEQATRFAAGR